MVTLISINSFELGTPVVLLLLVVQEDKVKRTQIILCKSDHKKKFLPLFVTNTCRTIKSLKTCLNINPREKFFLCSLMLKTCCFCLLI